MRFGQFDCKILVNGRPTEEYVPEVRGDKAFCVIESTEGARFAITWGQTSNTPHGSTLGKIFLDGQEVPASGHLDEHTLARHRKGALQSDSTVKAFTFGKLTTTDDEEAVSSSVAADNVGTIKLRLFRVTRAGRGTWNHNPTELASTFHEQDVKKTFVSHVASLGRSSIIPTQRAREWHYLDPPEEPFREFTFVYRSRASLIALDIISDDQPAGPPLNNPLPPRPVKKSSPPPPASIPHGSSRKQVPRMCAPSPSIRGPSHAPSHISSSHTSSHKPNARSSESVVDDEILSIDADEYEATLAGKRRQASRASQAVERKTPAELDSDEDDLPGDSTEVRAAKRVMREARDRVRAAKSAKRLKSEARSTSHSSGGGLARSLSQRRLPPSPPSGPPDASDKGKGRAPFIEVLDLVSD